MWSVGSKILTTRNKENLSWVYLILTIFTSESVKLVIKLKLDYAGMVAFQSLDKKAVFN